jgi:hypothetical protein
MLSKKVVFLSAQPDVPYFHWQVEVMLHNFMRVGINPNWIEVLWAHDGTPSGAGLDLAAKYPFVRFFFYPKRITENHGYIPILRPDIISQHFSKFPELERETIFYHDSDIIFRELPDFDRLIDGDSWYVSDTISYIGANYIKSKSDELFAEMCSIAKIDPTIVEENELNSGGAQYLMKGVNSNYWYGVRETALSLYKYMADRENLERKGLNVDEAKTYNPVQKWCSDMWAVLWEAWKIGAKTQIDPDLGFSWGTSSLSEYAKHKIMHNAGVTHSDKGRLFYKGEYITRSPFDADLSGIDQETASAKYVDAIMYAKQRRQ